jgi:hypothetical protein
MMREIEEAEEIRTTAHPRLSSSRWPIHLSARLQLLVRPDPGQTLDAWAIAFLVNCSRFGLGCLIGVRLGAN